MATDPSVRPFIFSFNSFFPHFFIGFSSFTRTRVHKINLCLNSLRICHYAAAATYAQPSNNSRYFYSFDSSAFTFTPLDENTGSAIFFDYFVRFVLVFRFYKSQQQCISLPRSALSCNFSLLSFRCILLLIGSYVWMETTKRLLLYELGILRFQVKSQFPIWCYIISFCHSP